MARGNGAAGTSDVSRKHMQGLGGCVKDEE